MIPGVDHKTIYNTFFDSMNDKEFVAWLKDIGEGKQNLCAFIPNMGNSGVTVENNLALGKKHGIEFFQKLWIEDTDSGRTSLTPITYLVMDWPYRRASQTIVKKASIPSNMNTVDSASGQPTGDSKGARMSLPELNITVAMGLDNLSLEMMKYRGGDIRGFAALNAMLSKHGRTNMQTLSQFASGVESAKTMKTLLACAHLKSTL
jgi:hypothetical protein